MNNNENIDLGAGWVIDKSLSFGELEAEEEESNLSPQQLLLAGITNKDAKSVEKAIKLGASVKIRVGKEKLPVFAIKHFNNEVVDVLTSNKVSWKDFNAIKQSIFETDNIDALKWYKDLSFNKANFFNNSKEGKKIHSQTTMAAMQAEAVNCFLYLYKNAEFKNEINEALCLQPIYLINFFHSAVNQKNHEALDLFFNEKVLSPYLKLAVKHTLTWGNISTYEHCLTVNEMFAHPERQKIWKDIFSKDKANTSPNSYNLNSDPAYTQYVYGSILQNFIKIKVDHTNKNTSSSSFHAKLIEYKPTNFLEALVCKGVPAISDIAKSSSGKKALLKVWEDEKLMQMMVLSSTKANLLDISKSMKPELSNWRDSNGNNFFHYMVASTEKHTKTLFLELAQNSMDLLLSTENNDGNTPVAGVSQELYHGVQKKLIKKEIKGEGSLKSSSNATKRKM